MDAEAEVNAQESLREQKRDDVEEDDDDWASSLPSRPQHELDCPLCRMLLYDPVTTACGHNFCRSCIIRAIDYSNKCPICRSTVLVSPDHAVNSVLKALAMNTFPDEYAQRALQTLRDEQKALYNLPLFILDLVLFPGMMANVHVYEQRYRYMVQHALEATRSFGIIYPGKSVGCIAVISSHVRLADGRSMVQVRGTKRFKVLNRWLDSHHGYEMAKVELILDDDVQQWKEESNPTKAKRSLAPPSTSTPTATSTSISTPAPTVTATSVIHTASLTLTATSTPTSETSEFPRLGSESVSESESLELVGTEAMVDSHAGDDPSVPQHQARRGDPRLSSLAISGNVQNNNNDNNNVNIINSRTDETINELSGAGAEVVEMETRQTETMTDVFNQLVAILNSRLRPSERRGLEERYGRLPVDDAQALSFWLAAALPIPTRTKQELLESRSIMERLMVERSSLKAGAGGRSLGLGQSSQQGSQLMTWLCIFIMILIFMNNATVYHISL